MFYNNEHKILNTSIKPILKKNEQDFRQNIIIIIR